MNKKLFLIPILLLLTLSCLSLFTSISNTQTVALIADQSNIMDKAIGLVQDKPQDKPGNPSNKPPKKGEIQYELFIEIDYMEGHEPTESVLDYITDYYNERGIQVTFIIDEIVTFDESIDESDFWAIEAQFNDIFYYDDKANGDPDEGVYTSKEKWILYGTSVEGEPETMGYTYVALGISYIPLTGQIIDVDCLAGNYIYIADGSTDNWANEHEVEGVSETEAEAVVLMHEMGHSIGIMKAGWSGNYYTGFTVWEIYDPDATSVMAFLNPDNCNASRGKKPYWHYSRSYWNLRNVEYYKI
ncbi:MAG: hypothetical protein L6N96_00305 [Candidatus Methylarchaceae archaeon HK02M2]|nr:hypothetical protein [Candidatus Methylarchaceae archaeon HK02M2]